MIFKGFDYGKGLMRQVDSYRRLTLLQQGKRHPVLAKALDTYIKKFMTVLENPGSGNPGQLKNAAEVMVEAAIALQETELTFAAYADMASRSRKVPVVPGLAGLVDRLLESPDEHKKYRIALFNWRIVAGSLRPERRLRYLSERAHLSQNMDHWRDYASGWLQLLEKKSLERDDKQILESLDDLHQNRKMAGDLATPLQLQCVELLLENGKSRQAEELLFELVGDYQNIYDLPRQFFTLVGELIQMRPDAGWELHQIVLDVAFLDYAAGKHGFSVVEKLIQRELGKSAKLLDFLLAHEVLVKDKRLSIIAISRIFNTSNLNQKDYLERWFQAYNSAGIEPPPEALELIKLGEDGEPVVIDELLATLTDEPTPELTNQVQIHDGDFVVSLGIGADDDEGDDEETADEPVEQEEQDEEDDEAEALEEDELGDGLVILEPAAAEVDEVDAETETKVEVAEGEEELTAEAAEEVAVEQADEELEPPELVTAETEEEPESEEVDASDEEPVASEQESEVAAEAAQPAESETDEEDEELAAILAEIHGPPASLAEESAESDEAADAAPDIEEPVAAIEAEQAEVDSSVELSVPELAGLEEAPEIWQALDKWLGEQPIGDGLAVLEHVFADGNLSAAAKLEVRLWLTERLLSAGLDEVAGAHLKKLDLPEDTEPDRLLDRITTMLGDDPPSAAMPVVSQLALDSGQFTLAYSAAAGLPPSDPQRANLLEALDVWIVSQPEPSPALLMVLAKTQRDLRDDPHAGFESATTASLLSEGDPQLQGDYAGWVIALAPEDVHRERARQATFLTAGEGHHSLLPTALTEIEALAGVLPSPPPAELLEWLDELRPVLDEVAGEKQQELRLRWTKLYLQVAAEIGEQERIQQVLSTAAELIAPDAAYTLVTELGHSLPQATRLRLECSVLVRQGQWQQALDIALDTDTTPREAVPLETLCAELPDEALYRAGTRLAEYYSDQDDAEGQLQVIQQLKARFGNGGIDASDADSLLGFLDEQLQALCERSYMPAVRYRLELTEDGDAMSRAKDLLALAQLGDTSVQPDLAELFPRLLKVGGQQPEVLLKVADYIVRHGEDTDHDAAIKLLAEAGFAAENPSWALEIIHELELKASSVEALELTGKLTISSKNYDEALDIADRLILLQAPLSAQALVESAAQEQPEQPRGLALLFSLLLQEELRDLPKATSVLLKLSQIYQHSGQNAATQLAPLGRQIDTALEDEPDTGPVLYLKLAHAALSGDQKRAAQLAQEVTQGEDSDSAELVALFEQLALEDTELPAPLVIAWGQALFDVGRLDDALARLAGLRDAVGNYPEYIAMLEEIKERGGGPGASMQLGEAYLRVHLWQRSSEEYAAALAEDPALAEPILTQLRHHAALDPNPMKYPLHVLGLKAVACSVRTADWGWALSALAWLKGRWSAEELYERAVELWQAQEQVELEPELRLELLLNLQSLAASIGEVGKALDYLEQAWDVAGETAPQLVAALAEYDGQNLPDSPETHFKLARLHFNAALSARDTEALLAAAGKLSEFGEEGRAFALNGLEEYKELTDDPLAITIARLRLFDAKTPEGAEAFLAEAKALVLDQLPREQAFSLVQTVVELTEVLPGNTELAELMMELFTQLGDFARVWQLGLNLFLDSKLGPLAVQALEATAADEFAVQQQVALVEVHQSRGDYTAVGKALTQLSWGNIAAFGPQVEALAESLLATPAATEARRWLITWYRERHEDTLAADHVVWAHATGDQQPAGWIDDAKTGDLLYRAALLRELAGDQVAAKRLLERARKAKAADPAIQAAVCLRLSELAETDGNLVLACELAQEAAAALPGDTTLSQYVTKLERSQVEKKIAAAMELEDSAERTLEIARLYRELKDYAQAVNELQNGLGRGQSQPVLFIELAECFTERGDLNLARRAFNEVLRRLEQVNDVEASLRARYGLAVTEERLGNPEETIRNLEQILVMRQDFRDSREWLNRLYGKESGAQEDSTTENILSEIFNLLGQPEDENPPKDGEG